MLVVKKDVGLTGLASDSAPGPAYSSSPAPAWNGSGLPEGSSPSQVFSTTQATQAPPTRSQSYKSKALPAVPYHSDAFSRARPDSRLASPSNLNSPNDHPGPHSSTSPADPAAPHVAANATPTDGRLRSLPPAAQVSAQGTEERRRDDERERGDGVPLPVGTRAHVGPRGSVRNSWVSQTAFLKDDDTVSRPSLDLSPLKAPTHWFRCTAGSPAQHARAPAASLPAGLLGILSNVPVFGRLVHFLEWEDLSALANANHFLRVFVEETPKIRLAILRRYVPSWNMLHSNGDISSHQPRMYLRDVDVLLRSLDFPIHLYPSYALHFLELPPWAKTVENERALRGITNLTIAHSRFVAHLRRRATAQTDRARPSSSTSATSINWRAFRKVKDFSEDAKPWSPPGLPGPPRPAELKFPAPLAYFPQEKAHDVHGSESRDVLTSLPLSAQSSSNNSSAGSLTASKERRKSAGLLPKPSGGLRMFSSNSTPLPPPQPTTKSIAFHRSRWNARQSLQGIPPPTLYGSPWSDSSSSAVVMDDMGMLTATPDSSRRSSVRSPHSRQSSLPVQAFFHSAVPSSSSSAASSSASSSITSSSPAGLIPSPHSLVHAASGQFAPVYRVFVPCSGPASALSEATLDACRAQLVTAGVWQYLARGDIVSNSGYVLDTQASFSSTFLGDTEALTDWLVFDGQRLAPFDARKPLPRNDTYEETVPQGLAQSSSPSPAKLWTPPSPNPAYYAHILPANRNPVYDFVVPSFLLKSSQRSDLDESLAQRDVLARTRFELTLVSASVQSSSGIPVGPTSALASEKPSKRDSYISLAGQSPLRGASKPRYRVQRFAWTARLPFTSGPAVGVLGPEWAGEWVLEAEGTPEGRRLLERIILSGAVVPAPGAVREAHSWEVMLERCEGNMVWLRLLSPHEAA